MVCEYLEENICCNYEAKYYNEKCNDDCEWHSIIFKKKGIASEVVLDIIETMEQTNDDEYVYVEVSYWGYPYDQHLMINIINDVTKKRKKVIEYYKVKSQEGYAIRHILKDMGGEYQKIGQHLGERYNYKKDYWIVEKEEFLEEEKYIVKHKEHLIPRYYFKDKKEADIVCDFMNREEIIKFR